MLIDKSCSARFGNTFHNTVVKLYVQLYTNHKANMADNRIHLADCEGIFGY